MKRHWTEISADGRPYSEWPNGWIRMSELLLVYDYISFAEEHQDEFYDYTGDYAPLYEVDDIVFWTWPGSGEKAWTLEKEWRQLETDKSFLVASHAYRDEEGREWGFFNYVYANKNTWVLLNDPGNANIEAFNPPPEPMLWKPDSSGVVSRGLPIAALAIFLVAGVVVASAVLIRIFCRRE